MYFSKSKFRFVVQFCLVAFSLSLTFLSFLAEKRIFLDVGNIDGHVRLTFSLGDKVVPGRRNASGSERALLGRVVQHGVLKL